MTAELTNHLWQSTMFALAAGLLAVALRKNGAQVRYWIWFSASLKFFIPFAILMSVGGYLKWAPTARKIATQITPPAVTFTMAPFSQPVLDGLPSAPNTSDWTSIAVLVIWMCGFGAIAAIRLQMWRRIRVAVRASSPLQIHAMEIPASVEVRSSPGLLEPGVVGLLHPILLLPADIVNRLTPRQLQAVIVHELCHIRRRDNLTGVIHMIAEAIFWFHPLVWWIGARLVEERERACDEEVLSLGSDPHDYAEGILNVCKLYTESPLACVSGITGANLKRRIEAIMINHATVRLTFARKVALALAVTTSLALPLMVGIMNASPIWAQSSKTIAQSASKATPPAKQQFIVASIKPCRKDQPAEHSSARQNSPGTLIVECRPVELLIEWAYGLFANSGPTIASPVPILGGPSWMSSDQFSIEAKAEGPASFQIMRGPMLRALLEDRFHLKLHRETREVPVYALTVAKGGPKLQPSKEGSCIAWDLDHLAPPTAPGQPLPRLCGVGRFTNGRREEPGQTMAGLSAFFSSRLDRIVIDRTGITGKYDIHLDLSLADLFPSREGSTSAPATASVDPQAPAPPADSSFPIFSAIRNAVQKLGLKLDPAKGPREFIVVDHVEKPSAN